MAAIPYSEASSSNQDGGYRKCGGSSHALLPVQCLARLRAKHMAVGELPGAGRPRVCTTRLLCSGHPVVSQEESAARCPVRKYTQASGQYTHAWPESLGGKTGEGWGFEQEIEAQATRLIYGWEPQLCTPSLCTPP